MSLNPAGYPRPLGLDDMVVDFTTNPSASATVFPSQFTSAFAYTKKLTGGISNNQTIDIAGTPTNSWTWTTNTYVGAPAPSPVNVRRFLTSPGVYNDVIKYEEKQYTTIGELNTPNTYTSYIAGEDSWKYLVFAKAIVNVTIDGVTATNGKNYSKIVNTPISFSEMFPIGGGYTTNITKLQIFDGVWRDSVQGVDHSFDTGSGWAGDTTFQLLKVAAYRFTITGKGATSFNHPYGSTTGAEWAGRNTVSSNENTISFTIDAGSGLPPEDAITFPKIQTIVVPNDLISSSPLKSYQNSVLNISGVVLYDTGTWKTGSVDRSPAPSHDDWDTELLARCNIKLHITNLTTNTDVITPLDGLGPHQVSIPTAGNYRINYITSLK